MHRNARIGSAETVLAEALRLARACAATIVFLACSSAVAGTPDQETRRHPTARITVKQWNEFLAETKSREGAVVVSGTTFTRIEVSAEQAVYLFTTRRHAAYPAAARRAITSVAGKTYIHTSGYYAGNRTAFVAWMAALAEQDRRLQEFLETTTRRNEISVRAMRR